MKKNDKEKPVKEKPKAKEKKAKGKKPVSKARLIARIVSIALTLVVVACCAIGDWYVHQPREWQESHRAFYTAPLRYFGNRTAFITDAFGWTGHDAVYDPDDETAPSNTVLFAGAPVRIGAPAPDDIKVLNRGEFMIGWSPSLRHPVWAAYHVVRDARFDALKRPNFQKDRSVASSPAANDYARSGYDRGHLVPNRAIVTRYGPDEQEKTFLMTNIAPQRPALNRGPWREMEQRISDLWTARYGEIWVIVGAVSPTSNRTKLENTTIDVPEQYYMLIAAQDKEGVRALAVLLPQTAEVNDFPVHNIVTIKELETATGLEFFPDMPKFLARPLKADRPTRLWPIRWYDIVKLILLRFT